MYTLQCNYIYITTTQNRCWFTIYQYRRNQLIADHGWKVLLLLGTYSTTKRFSSNENINRNSNTIKKNSVNVFEDYWPIKYSRTLGNKKWVATILTTINFIIMISISISICLFNFEFNADEKYLWIPTTCSMINSVFILVGCAIIPIVVISKVNRFTDLIYIRNEMIGVSRAAVTIPILAIPFSIYRIFWHVSRGNTSIYFFGLIIVSVTLAVWYEMIDVVYKFNANLSPIHRLCNLAIGVCPNRCICKKSDHDTDAISNIVDVANTYNSGSPTSKFGINNVLSHEIGYRLFMRHLVEEFATENLLFYTEIIQFKYKSNIFSNYTTSDEYKMSKDYIIFPPLSSKIPQSNIMKENNILNKIAMIMDRYIIDSAELQVNISSQNRRKLFEKMNYLQSNNNNNNNNDHDTKTKRTSKITSNNSIDIVYDNEAAISTLNLGDSSNPGTTSNNSPIIDIDLENNSKEFELLFTFFDDACEEIIRLLRKSFINFSNTQQYNKWVQEMS